MDRWTRLWRGPGGLALRRCLSTTVPPTLLATILALAAHYWTRPELDGEHVPGAATPWLTMPLLVAAIGCCVAAAQLWPTFAVRQPGADAVRRLQTGPFGGRGAVIAGAVLAQLLLTVPLTTVLARCLDAPAMARRHVLAEPPPDPVLARNGGSTRLRFSLPDTTTETIWLRPIAAMPIGSMEPTQVRLTVDDVPLAMTPIAFAETRELVQVTITPRSLRHLELTLTAGNVPLLFGRGSVVAIGPANLPTWQNGLMTAALAAATSLVTLALAALVGLGAGWPVLLTLIAGAQLVQWVGGVGPTDEAILALLRGQWLLTSS